MKYDDFKRQQKNQSRSRFNEFKAQVDSFLRKKEEDTGDSETYDPEADEFKAIILELSEITTDRRIEDAALRALKIYRNIVYHAKAGGSVQFVNPDGSRKTLKVPLK